MARKLCLHPLTCHSAFAAARQEVIAAGGSADHPDVRRLGLLWRCVMLDSAFCPSSLPGSAEAQLPSWQKKA